MGATVGLALVTLLVGCGDGAPNQEQPVRASGAFSAVEPAETPSAESDIQAGEELFGRIGCNGCHTIEGVGGIVGPDLSRVGARPSRDPARWPTTEEYIRASLEGPEQYVVEGYTPDMPPPDLLGIDPADIDRLVAYLLTRRSE